MLNLAEIRKKKNIKQLELAVITGLSQTGVNYLEHKDIMKAQFGTVLKVSKALDIDLNQFKEYVTIREIKN